MIYNFTSISRNKFISGYGDIYNAAIPNGTVEELPYASIIGNDDSSTSDENDDPSTAYTATDLDHAVGEISSYDTPRLFMPDAAGQKAGDTFEQDFLPQEFVRLQIGGRWYVVSDPIPWHVKQILTFDGKAWQDNHSSIGSGN